MAEECVYKEYEWMFHIRHMYVPQFAGQEQRIGRIS